MSTPRLELAKFSFKDVEANLKHEMTPAIMKYIRDPLPENEVMQKSIEVAAPWQGIEGQWSLLSIRLKSTNEFIGILSMCYESIENDTIELGWRLHPNFHRKGYAFEAAESFLNSVKSKLKPHKIVAYCVAENTASSKMMKKLGMTQEGCLKQFSKLNGHWCDEDVFGLVIDY